MTPEGEELNGAWTLFVIDKDKLSNKPFSIIV